MALATGRVRLMRDRRTWVALDALAQKTREFVDPLRGRVDELTHANSMNSRTCSEHTRCTVHERGLVRVSAATSVLSALARRQVELDDGRLATRAPLDAAPRAPAPCFGGFVRRGASDHVADARDPHAADQRGDGDCGDEDEVCGERQEDVVDERHDGVVERLHDALQEEEAAVRGRGVHFR